MCLGHTFVGQLNHMGVRLRGHEAQELFEAFRTGEPEEIDYLFFFAHAYTNWSTQREEFVQGAFENLSQDSPGGVATYEVLQSQFKPSALTKHHVPFLTDHNSAQEFFHQWSSGVLREDGAVAWLDFVDYYLDVSAMCDSEQEFCDYVCASWSIDTDDMLAKRVFFRYCTNEQGGVLPAHAFITMLMEMDSNITELEAMAWYEAISERDNGEVSLQEFLSSKVLKVKRLFDDFGQGQRQITFEQMAGLLHSLNGAITDEEVSIMCTYVDTNDNGKIDFTEFLRQNLLKVLKIFDDFKSTARNGDHVLGEIELKALLRKIDPFLDDREITNIYKAIDVDSSGQISFIEFVQSQVFRAKGLFDHYDKDKCKSLTHLKFRDLLLDLDETLTPTELEALFQLVADARTDRVTLSGLLSPNVVKLKRLFDKYDKDHSKALDIHEYRAMLKELFYGLCESDIEVLVRTALPDGDSQEISLVEYIRHFKAIESKCDVLVRSRLREAKEKARARGLAFDPRKERQNQRSAPLGRQQEAIAA